MESNSIQENNTSDKRKKKRKHQQNSSKLCMRKTNDTQANDVYQK